MVKKAGKGRPEDSASRDALVRWLTTPGNAERWRTGDKNALCREIMASLIEQGLASRKETYVRYKLTTMQKQYLSAKSWLLNAGHYKAFESGTANEETTAQVEILCPNFRQLATVFDVPGTAAPAEEKREIVASTDGVATAAAVATTGQPSGNAVPVSVPNGTSEATAATKEEPGKELPLVAIVPKTAKRVKTPAAAGRSPNPKRRATSTPSVLSDSWVIPHRGRKSPKFDGASKVTSEEAAALREKEEREQQHELFSLKRAILENELDAKRSINENEVKARRAMTQRELKAKQAQLDVQVACEKLLARQKLLDAGVALADIDRVL